MRLFLVLLLSLTVAGCAHGPCRALGDLFGCSCAVKPAPVHAQNAALEVPSFDGGAPIDLELDGYSLQAIRIAADDFLGPDYPHEPCWDRQTAHRYRTSRKGDVIWVRINYKKENCGDRVGALDSGATYAINVYGQILQIQPY